VLKVSHFTHLSEDGILSDPGAPEYCETEVDGIMYAGECATQAELDDLLILVAALDYDVEQWVNALNAAAGGHCDPSDPECGVVIELTGRCDGDEEMIMLGEGCGAQIAGAVAAVAGWGFAKLGAIALSGTAKVSAAAVAAVAGGSITAAIGVGLAVGAAILCLT
jgi:hypothetical protein